MKIKMLIAAIVLTIGYPIYLVQHAVWVYEEPAQPDTSYVEDLPAADNSCEMVYCG